MNRTYEMTYETGEKEGLLKTFTKPNGATNKFEYDDLGLLVKDENAEGGSKEIIQTGVEGSGKVEVKTAMGRVTSYETNTGESSSASDSNKIWENSGATGCKTKTTFSDDYNTEILKPNGMRAIIKKIPSRFGEGVKDTLEVRAIFPSGREMIISTEKEITQEDITDPLSVTTIKTTTTINQNRSVIRFYDKINKTLTTTSPMNRSEKSYFDDKNRLIKVERPEVAAINYEYDDKGRLKKITQKDRFVEFNFNDSGYLETVEDNAGNIEEYIYDEAGRVVITRTNNDVNSDFKVDYDENNNASKITPAENKEHNFTYDLVDRVKTYSSPKIGEENNVTSYDYNLDGQSILTTTPDTNSIVYNYNELTARLESVNYVALEGNWDTEDLEVTKTINYIYDTDKDQLTSINLDNSTLVYEYDGGLLLSESSSTYTSKLEWVYDDNLRVEGIKLTTNGHISSASISRYGL